ncbi:beta-glucosidase [Botrytis cinerea]
MTNRFDVEDVLSKLNNVEKVSLLAGTDWWHTAAIPKHNVPSIRVSDGPNGVRGTRFFNGITAACFPCGTALAATWDTKLLHRAGVLMGKKRKQKVSPLGGRGFESFSEDPVLSGLGAAALVNGIQETGVQATIKHFRALREIYLLPFQLVVRDSKPALFMSAYNKINGTHVSENPKILKDILRGEWGWSGCVMSDWWGTYSTTGAINAGLDLEMPGSTKWRGPMLIQAVSTGKVPQHILDERARNVLNAVNRAADANVPENAEEKTADTPETAALLREIAGDSIVLMKNEGSVLPFRKDKKVQYDIQLLLYINPKLISIDFYCRSQRQSCYISWGGSASLAAYYAVTPFDGISQQLKSAPTYTVGAYAHKDLPLLDSALKTDKGERGISFRAYNEPPTAEDREIADEIILTKTELLMMDYYCSKLKNELWWADVEGYMTAEEDCDFEFGLGVYGTANLYVDGKLIIDNTTKQTRGTMFFSCGTVEERGVVSLKKGQTYHLKIEFASSPTCKLDKGNNVLFGPGAIRLGGAKIIDADEEIARAAELAKEADQVIICAGLNSDWEGEGADREIFVVVIQSGTPVDLPFLSTTPALLQAWYGGNETGNAIADVIFGKTNPSAKLPLSFPKRIEDNPAFLSFRSERGRVIYGEDIYMGYRWYDALNLPVLFPFGHGLSYTTFAISDLNIEKSDKKIKISVKVKNTGEVSGAEVVQVYIQQQNPSIRRPNKELKGFEKVFLKAGEEKRVEVDIEVKYAAAFWDEVREAWVVEKDAYDVLVGNTSELAGELKATFEVERTEWWNGL